MLAAKILFTANARFVNTEPTHVPGRIGQVKYDVELIAMMQDIVMNMQCTVVCECVGISLLIITKKNFSRQEQNIAL